MRRLTFTARRATLTIVATFVGALVVAAPSVQARLVDDGGTQAGVSLLPGTRNNALPSGVTAMTSSGPCLDPWLSSDLGGPAMPSPSSDGLSGLCYRGGAVMHKNETFALTWDQPRAYWSQTRGYVEQFLRDVADASGSLASPYAVTTQYNDGAGRAQNASLFGGGCIDYGSTGGSACEYGSPTGAGHDYPSGGCTPEGSSFASVNVVTSNTICLTDAQLQGEVSTMVTQTGILGRTQPGYTPLVALLLPPGVETCLDGAHTLCSANSQLTPPPPDVSTSGTGGSLPAATYGVEITYVTGGGESVASSAQTVTTTGGTSTITIASPPPASGATGWYAYVTQPNGNTYTRQGTSPSAIGSSLTLTSVTSSGATAPQGSMFCSYHSQVNVGGTEVAYVVQPWTAGTGCDEPGLPNIPTDPTPQQLSVAVGARLVSPLSQAHIAAIVDPGLNGWAALDGSETMDNHVCTPLPRQLDSVDVGGSSQNPYFLQREFNNAGVLEFDPTTYFGCAPVVNLAPEFVVPSAVNQGDVVQFDGSATASTLIVPSASYAWNFGDGTTATGPSPEHAYRAGGTYNVSLTVTDRGGNRATLTQTIAVLGSSGQPVGTPPPSSAQAGSPQASQNGSLQVSLRLTPQSLGAVTRRGLSLQVRSNRAANGIVSISISRAAAKRAHIRVGHGSSVVIARGTTAAIRNGVVTLRLGLPRSVVAKLKRLGHVTLTVRLSVVATGGSRLAVDAAGRY